MNIVVVGTAALDDIETPFGKVKGALGGSAIYFSVAASYFTDVSIVAVVGKDFPREHVDFLKSRGIDTSGLTVEEGETFKWSGIYGFDLNNRETIETRLNVFENFRPVLPEEMKDARYIFLANMDPEIQSSVMDQVREPALVACDTMNFYIEGKRKELLATMERVDLMVMNDSECRQLAEEPNLIKASRLIMEMGGPRKMIVKKGEHGALLFTPSKIFSAPAYPCESVFDPTGAGDSFAGGVMGYLTQTCDLSEAGLRKAIMYGTVLASFCVEKFSVDGMASLTRDIIEERYVELKELTLF